MILVDTWGWYALGNPRDPAHGAVRDLYRDLQRQGRRPLTTDYILDELITLLFRRVPAPQAQRFLEGLLESIALGYVRVERITPHRFQQAWDLRLKYRDHPRLSFTNCTSFVVMRDLAVDEALTDDSHFLKVNLGFRIRP